MATMLCLGMADVTEIHLFLQGLCRARLGGGGANCRMPDKEILLQVGTSPCIVGNAGWGAMLQGVVIKVQLDEGEEEPAEEQEQQEGEEEEERSDGEHYELPNEDEREDPKRARNGEDGPRP